MTLQTLLALEQDGPDRFHYQPGEDAQARIFGGLLAAQAVTAGMATVADDRPAHSLHAHFLRAGDGGRPILFTVDRMRDGGSYSTRSVIAEQDGRLLLDARLSFQGPAEGLTFTSPMPHVPGPEGLRSEDDLRSEAIRQIEVPLVGSLGTVGMAFELRPVFPRDYVNPRVMAPVQHFWLRPIRPIEGDWRRQFAALTYASDMMLLSTTLLPHGIYWSTTAMDSASLDHAIWYHALPDFTDWMLWTMETTWSGNGRGLAQGRFYRRDGTLVASCVQEGLIRVRETVTAP